MNSRANTAGFLFLFTVVAMFVISGSGRSAPTVLSTFPLRGAMSVTLNSSVSATFSNPMTEGSLSTTTFTLTSGTPAVSVPGTVIYSLGRATFTPSAPLVSGTRYQATITTGAQSDDGVALTLSHGWSFTSGDGPRSLSVIESMMAVN